MTEMWRAVKCCPVYLVSNLGRVKRLPGFRVHGGILKTSKRGGRHGLAYESVTLICLPRGIRRSVYVHRLVAEAFLGPCPEDHEVNHRDFNRSNNRATNLEYLTHQENLLHSRDAGRFAKKAA